MIVLPSLAQLVALARRIPGMAWVILLTAAIAGAGWFAAVHVGEQRGEVKVQRAATADSIVHVTATLKVARVTSDSIGRVATRVRSSADSGRAVTRAVMEAHLTDTPLEVQQSVSAQLTRDSLAHAMETAHSGSLLAERPLEERRDSLRVNQAAIGVPTPDQHRTRYLVGGAMLGAGLVITILHFVK